MLVVSVKKIALTAGFIFRLSREQELVNIESGKGLLLNLNQNYFLKTIRYLKILWIFESCLHECQEGIINVTRQ